MSHYGEHPAACVFLYRLIGIAYIYQALVRPHENPALMSAVRNAASEGSLSGVAGIGPKALCRAGGDGLHSKGGGGGGGGGTRGGA